MNRTYMPHPASRLLTEYEKKLRQKKDTIYAVPDDKLVEWSLKLFSLMNLTWTYVDTICDLCVQMRRKETKGLVRTVRELKREYDRFRQYCMPPELEKDEERRALLFEEYYSTDFDRLFNGLHNEVSKLGLDEDNRIYVIAVQQCLTLIDAVKLYARWCDAEIAKYGAWVCDCCMVHSAFLMLAELMPRFAGDCYQPDLETRRLTAGILKNRLLTLKIDVI